MLKLKIDNVGESFVGERPEIDVTRKLKDAGQLVPLVNNELQRLFNQRYLGLSEGEGEGEAPAASIHTAAILQRIQGY